MPPELQLTTLGKLQISQAGRPVIGFVSAKAQALLCYLAMTGRFHSRQALAALLWGDMPEVEARTNLRTALSNLRKLLAPYLIISRESVSFNRASPYWLDAELFQAALAAAGLSDTLSPGESLAITPLTETSPASLLPLRQAAELYQGDLLEGFAVREAPAFEEWLLAQRERLRQLAMQALYTLAREHTARGEYAAGIDYTSRLLALEPWREEGHRQMMILLARSEQRSAALAQYESCRRILAEELGVEPAAETQALYERLKAANTVSPHNLPPQATPFVNRAAELAQMASYLENPGCRLLTLVGPGGIGKTRLALQAAAENLSLFRDGVFFVAAAPLSSPEALVINIANALDLPLSGPRKPEVQLYTYLQPKELLLVLDNFEHLLASTMLLANSLRAAPRLKLLVTSRERLNLQEEWVLEVEGLAVPADPQVVFLPLPGKARPDPLPLSQSQGPKQPDLASYSAVTLFIQQAQRVQADFALSAANQTDVARLCRLVDGMPLGLELAATWLPVLSCSEIATEIERDLDFLATSLRNVPDRHRSIRAVFESSWHLLAEAERGVLKRLSIFQGGFQREAAIQVAGATLPLLLALLNKSLLHRDATGRYDMHELLRQYAAEKLEQSPAEQTETQARHAAYYAQFMQQRDKLLQSSGQVKILQEIETELENVQAAWQYAVEREEVKLIVQCVWSLGLVYSLGNRFYAGVELFSRVADRWRAWPTAAETEKRLVYGQLLAIQGDLYWSLTRLELARDLSQQSLALLKPLQAYREAGFASQTLGLVAWHQGGYVEARQYFEESVALARLGDHLWTVTTSTSMLGLVAYTLGEYTQAERLLRQSLPVLREMGQLWGLGLTLDYLGSTMLELGRLAEAKQLLEESLAISRQVGDMWTVAHCLTQLGVVLNLMDDPQRLEAKHLQQESATIFREMGDRWGLAMALNHLGQTSCALAEYQAARHYLQTALQTAHASQLIPTSLDILISLAELQLQAGPAEPVLRHGLATVLDIFPLVLNHPASSQATKDRAARLLARYETKLPRPALTVAGERPPAKGLTAMVAEILAQ